MPLFEVRRANGAGFANGTAPAAMLNTLGQIVTCDFYTSAILDGRGYQVRLGTITTPVTGDVAITDAAAEMCADAAAGTTLMPFSAGLTLYTKGGDAFEAAGKSVATVSSGGTAFTPLPLRSGGTAAVSTARAQAAGNVVVTAELATTTLRHFEWGEEFVQDAGTEGWMPGNPFVWEPKAAPVLVGARCFYVQVASATGGPGYMAHFDYLEFPTLLVVPS